MIGETDRTIRRTRDFRLWIVVEGALVGIPAGFVVSLLRLGMGRLEKRREAFIGNGAWTPEKFTVWTMIVLAAFLLVCLIVWIQPAAGASGIPQLKAELQGKMEEPWPTTLAGRLVGTMTAIGTGLSMGNEGPSVQLGAMCGKMISRMMQRMGTEEKLLMTCGAGAGLASAFSAPFAGTMFALEDLHSNLSKEILASTMAASITASLVTVNIFGLRPVVSLNVQSAVPVHYYWFLLPLGVLTGAAGVGFNRVTDFLQTQYGRIHNKYLRMLIPFLLLLPVAVFVPDIMGAGYHSIESIAAGGMAFRVLIVFALLKFCFALSCTTSGTPGGIFLPILVMGAAFGGGYYALVDGWIPGDQPYLANFVLCGMVGYFAASIRAPLTGVILITEMTGNFQNFLSLSVVALLAVFTAQMLKGVPIYEQLLNRLLVSQGETPKQYRRRKVLTETDVHMGSYMDGTDIAHMELPRGCLVVSVLHNGIEAVPDGSTRVYAGDKMSLICNEADLLKVNETLERLCRTYEGAGPKAPGEDKK